MANTCGRCGHSPEDHFADRGACGKQVHKHGYCACNEYVEVVAEAEAEIGNQRWRKLTVDDGPWPTEVNDLEVLAAASFIKTRGTAVPNAPQALNTYDKIIDCALIESSLVEFKQSDTQADAVIALVQIVHQVKCIAAMHGLHYAWPELWREVHRARRDDEIPNVVNILKSHGAE